MTAATFKQLTEQAFAPKKPALYATSPEEVYAELEQLEKDFLKKKHAKIPEQLSFKFEQVRLGVAASLINLFTLISENEDSKQVLKLLQKGLKAQNIAEIDELMHKNIEVFENLLLELFEDETKEYILMLFEKTLQAESKKDLDEVIEEALMFLNQEDID